MYAAEKEMELLMDIITSIRNIRGEMRIPPSRKLQVLISVPDEGNEKYIEDGKDYIINLANLEIMIVEVNLVEPKGVATEWSAQCGYLFRSPVLWILPVKKRVWKKNWPKYQKIWNRVRRKLANRDFREKAAPAVIKKEEDKLKDFQERNSPLWKARQEAERHAISEIESFSDTIDSDRNSEAKCLQQISKLLEAALAEDIGTGDITTQAIVSREKEGQGASHCQR